MQMIHPIKDFLGLGVPRVYFMPCSCWQSYVCQYWVQYHCALQGAAVLFVEEKLASAENGMQDLVFQDREAFSVLVG